MHVLKTLHGEPEADQGEQDEQLDPSKISLEISTLQCHLIVPGRRCQPTKVNWQRTV